MWINSLADGESFQALGKQVPHGLKDSVLLDQLSKKRVPAPRANWSIKVIGCDEMRVGSQTDYSSKWTLILTKHLGEKLRDLAKESSEEKKQLIKVRAPLFSRVPSYCRSPLFLQKMCRINFYFPCGKRNGSMKNGSWISSNFSPGSLGKLGSIFCFPPFLAPSHLQLPHLLHTLSLFRKLPFEYTLFIFHIIAEFQKDISRLRSLTRFVFFFSLFLLFFFFFFFE